MSDKRVIRMNPKPHPLAQFKKAMPDEIAAPEFVIDNVLAAGTAVIAGERGLGKTSVLVPLMMCATGLLNGFSLQSTIKRKVVYVSEDVEQVQRIVRAMADDGLLDGSQVDGWFFPVQSVRMPASEIVNVVPHLDDLWTNQERVDGTNYVAPPVVVLDTTNATIELESISENSEVSRAVAKLREGFGDIPLVLVGHVPKASRADAKLTSFAGAGAWEGDTQQTLYLVSDNGNRYLVAGKRRFESEASEWLIEGRKVTFEALDPLGYRHEIGVFYGVPQPSSLEARELAKAEAAENAQEARMMHLRMKVLDYVTKHPGASTRRIRESVTGRGNAISAVLEELIADGEIRVEEGPRNAAHHHRVLGTTGNHSGLDDAD